MTYAVGEQDIHHYHTTGYVVFRRILPASLLTDLRREAEKAREIARRQDANAQRLQPIRGQPSIDARPFRDYAELPELVEAVRAVLGPAAWLEASERSNLGILFEPAERPWATAWHRDFGPLQRRVDPGTFAVMRGDFRYFHQVNCALYADSCTWYVPGSHLRADFPAEAELAQNSPWQVGMDRPELSSAEVERYCLEYVERMPRAICLHLQPGDFALYRNSGYHLGCYSPHQRRATLHETAWTPHWKVAYERWGRGEAMAPATDAEAAAAR